MQKIMCVGLILACQMLAADISAEFCYDVDIVAHSDILELHSLGITLKDVTVERLYRSIIMTKDERDVQLDDCFCGIKYYLIFKIYDMPALVAHVTEKDSTIVVHPHKKINVIPQGYTVVLDEDAEEFCVADAQFIEKSDAFYKASKIQKNSLFYRCCDGFMDMRDDTP